MIAYALVNYCCFAAATAKTPGWRPSFKYYNKYLSLFGCAICIAIIFAMNWLYAVVSLSLIFGLFIYLERAAPNVNWGPAGEYRRDKRSGITIGPANH